MRRMANNNGVLIGAILFVAMCMASPTLGQDTQTFDVEKSFVFADEWVSPWKGYMGQFIVEPWNADDKAATVKLLEEICERAPGLVDRATGDRPLRLYRVKKLDEKVAGNYSTNEHAMRVPDSTLSKAKSNDDGAMQTVVHELTHAADNFSQISWDARFIDLVQPRLEKARQAFINRTGMTTVDWEVDSMTYDPENSAILEEVAEQAGLPSGYATKTLAESLADYVARMFVEDEYRPPAEVRNFIEEDVLRASARDVDAIALTHHAMIAVAEDRNQDAYKLFTKAIELAPEMSEIYRLRAHIWKDPEWKVKDLRRAIDTAIELESQPTIELARVLGGTLKQPHEAVAVLDRYLAEHPKAWEALAIRGEIWLSNDMPGLALQDCNKAVELGVELGSGKAVMPAMNRHYSVKKLALRLLSNDAQEKVHAAKALAHAHPVAVGTGANVEKMSVRVCENAIAALEQATNDGDQAVREAAIESLKVLREKQSNPRDTN